MSHLDIKGVNELSAQQYVVMFCNVIELCADAARHTEKERPFNTVNDLVNAFSRYLDNLSEDGKLTIAKLHPDLAGRLAAQGQLTKESAGEQSSAGLDRLSVEQKQLIDSYNKRYKDKFGFPFIICARENKVQSIIEGLQQRYNNTRKQEINIATEEVKKICKLRILDIVSE